MKKASRNCRKALIAALLLCTLAECGLLAGIVVNAKRLNAPMAADALIVLGAQVYPSGTPSPALKRRLDVAISLYAQGLAGSVITTGAQGGNEPCPEAEAMKAYLIEHGIPEDAVYCDPSSYNTVENLTHAKEIMDAEGLVTSIVVTSDYHLWRALSICKRLGLPATGAGSKNAETVPVAIRNCLQESLSWMKYLLTR